MDFNDYQEQAMVFRKPTADTVYAAYGLAEEAGEVCGKLAKARRDSVPPQEVREQMIKELGDVLWMVAALAKDFSLPLEVVARHNIDKLNGRLARGTIGGSGDMR